MDIGVFGMNSGGCADPTLAVEIAQAAEELGYESLWVGEHVVLPDPRVPPSPLAPDATILDPIVTLSHLAAATRRVRLGTGIVILPQRNPVVLAKELASLDVVSGGRLLFGVGVGYLQPEFAAVGVPFADRGPRTIEYLEAMQALWSMAKPAYHGRFVDFAGIDAHPRPVQQPIPIIMGGGTPPAFRRAVERGHGWYGFGLDPAATALCLTGLDEAQRRYERPSELGRLEITITPPLRSTERAAYSDLGVDRMVLVPSHSLDRAGLHAWLEERAP
jgi:probable F420-dependent oxidoreductase